MNNIKFGFVVSLVAFAGVAGSIVMAPTSMAFSPSSYSPPTANLSDTSPEAQAARNKELMEMSDRLGAQQQTDGLGQTFTPASSIGAGPGEPSLWDKTVNFIATYNSLLLWAGILVIGIYLLVRNRRTKTRVQ